MCNSASISWNSVPCLLEGGLIVWGPPWDPYGWEVMEGCVKNWDWVVKGCHEILESTNYWLAQRGEQQSFFDFP
ncbi:hypothetical protein V1507DRAFT_494668 [Lipomyces tetrasporus]